MTLAETVGVEEDRIIIEDIQFLEEPPVADHSSNNTTTTYTTTATTPMRRLLRGAPVVAHDHSVVSKTSSSRFLQEENVYTVLVDYVVTFPEEATEEEGADLFTRMTAGETFNEVVRTNFHSHGGHMMEVMSVENDGLEMHYGEDDRDHDKPFYESRRFIFIAGGAAAVLLLTCVSCYCCSERCLCCHKKRLYKSSGRNTDNGNANQHNSPANNERVTDGDGVQQFTAFQATTTNAGMINRQLELPTPTYWQNNVAPQPLPTFITAAPVATYTPTYYPQPLATMAPTTNVDPRQQQALQQQPQPVVVNINNGGAASGERE